RGSVSQQELDNAVQNNLANLAAVAAARAAVLNSRAKVTQSEAALQKAAADVETQHANIAAARAALDDARLNLGYTRVTSPIDGIAGLRGANIGDFVGPSDATPLTSVSKVDPIYAQFPISEQRALAVFRRWDADPKAPRSIELQLILSDGSVYPTPGRAAVLDRQVDDTVDVRAVQVNERVGSLWVVTQGLKPGERVVVEGGDRVRAGQKVRPEASAPSAPGPTK